MPEQEITPQVEALSKIRYKICLACEDLSTPLNICRNCGCFMKVKTIWMKAKCPLGKW